jgi:hypothetical protein
MSFPSYAKVASSVTYEWSDDRTFSGYLLIGLVPPTGRSFANIDKQMTSVIAPPFVRIKITNGVPDQNIGVIYTTDLNPPGFRYVAWLEDEQKTQVAGPSEIFTITSATFEPVFSGPPSAPTTADDPVTPNFDADDVL